MLMSDALRLVVGLVTAILTTRLLGPSGKGTLSSMLFIIVLLSYACSLGLGDAAIVLIGQKRVTVSEALSATILPMSLGLAAGLGLFWVVSLNADWSGIRPAVGAASVLLLVSTTSYVLMAMFNSQERLGLTALVAGVTGTVAALAVVLFVAVLELEILGGVLAELVGTCAGLAMLLWTIRKEPGALWPRFDRAYLRAAFRLGPVIEGSTLLVALAQRLDLLIVYSIRGEASAGRYAIATTLSQLASYGPVALTSAAFPRLAGLKDREAATLLAQLSRLTIAAASLGAVILLATVPFAIPLLFGIPFRAAIVPTLVLTLGGIAWSEQWLLCRAAAARGAPLVYFRSFGVSLLCMVALDLIFIPRWGLIGAALASVSSGIFGLAECARYYRAQVEVVSLRSYLPGPADFVSLFSLTRDVLVGMTRTRTDADQD